MKVDWGRLLGCLGAVAVCLALDAAVAYGVWCLACWAVSLL